MAGLVGRIKAGLSERLASAWILLSDTTNFLSRTSIFPNYEAELAEMRSRLTLGARDESVARELKKELVALREGLRAQGYDLSLGALELSLQGFRNDAATAEGFRRLVLFIGRRSLWFLEGEANHLELHRILDAELCRAGLEVLQKHYLWYRWSHGLLILSGADSESRSDFEELRLWCEQPERRLALLGKLKRLR